RFRGSSSLESVLRRRVLLVAYWKRFHKHPVANLYRQLSASLREQPEGCVPSENLLLVALVSRCRQGDCGHWERTVSNAARQLAASAPARTEPSVGAGGARGFDRCLWREALH